MKTEPKNVTALGRIMKNTLLAVVMVLLSGCGVSNREPKNGVGYITVEDSQDVFTAQLPRFEGTYHGDGVAGVTVVGMVLDRNSKLPIRGAKFHIEPTNSFSDFANEKIRFESGADGRFRADIMIGAAMMKGGSKDGTVYQTAKSKLVVEKEGYRNTSVLIDYGMPPIAIFLKPN